MKLKRFLVEAGVAGARDCANKDQVVRLALQNPQLDFAALHADVTVQRAAEARALEERKAREAAAVEAEQRRDDTELNIQKTPTFIQNRTGLNIIWSPLPGANRHLTRRLGIGGASGQNANT